MKIWVKRSLIAIMIFAVIAIISVLFFQPFGAKNALSDEVKMLTETYPTDIIVYGNNIDFDKEIPSRKVDELDANVIYDDGEDYFYRVLIINDLEDELTFDEDDWEVIDQCIEKGCNLFYLGTQYLEVIKDRYNCNMGLNDTDMFIGIAHEADNTTIGIYGVWDTETYAKYGTANLATDLIDVIMAEIRDYARQL